MHKTRVWVGILLGVTIGMVACANDATKPRYVPPADSTAQNDSTKHPG
jgi:hypothetical protein